MQVEEKLLQTYLYIKRVIISYKFYNVLLLRCLLHIINVSHFVLHICRLMNLSVMSVGRTIVIKPGMTVDL